jgi:hypothetical protein
MSETRKKIKPPPEIPDPNDERLREYYSKSISEMMQEALDKQAPKNKPWENLQ